jgi:hypothetical protein
MKESFQQGVDFSSKPFKTKTISKEQTNLYLTMGSPTESCYIIISTIKDKQETIVAVGPTKV